MENRWTSSQLQAIETVDRDVSVSAGAGSGKTGVLAERYLRIVRRSRAGELPDSQAASIGQILVITFTEKATREMKSRIARSLMSAGLHAERRELENAFISTFHAFCSRLLKENPFEAGVDPEFTVLEESESRRLIRQAFESALDHAFEHEDEEIIELASSAQNERRRDKDVRDSMAVLCGDVEAALGKLRGAGWREDGLRRLLEAGVDSLGTEALKSVAAWVSPYLERLLGLRDELKRFSRGTIGNLENKRQLAVDALSGVTIPESWDELAIASAAVCAAAKVLSGTLKPRRNAPADDYKISEILEGIKSTCKELELLKTFDAEREIEALRNSLRFLKLTLRTWEFYSLAKQEQSLLDNEDLPSEAVHLLGESESVRQRYRRRFKHILVDEFQDTDPLQVRLIDALHAADSSGIVPNSLFRVGDVQQSIYAFRNADPSIFQSVVAEAGRVDGGLVTLRENFRSRPQILRFINRVFEHAWRDSGNHFTSLEPGKEYSEAKRPRVDLIVTADPRSRPVYLDQEARVVARRIRELVDTGSRGEDARVDGEGPIRYGDIAVLFRAITEVDRYERAFRREGIPYFVVGGGRGYYARFEIRDVLNLLTILDSPLDDVALLAALRSPLVGLDTDTIYALTLFARGDGGKRRNSLYPTIPRFLESGESQRVDRQRLLEFYEILEDASRKEDRMPVGELLELLVGQFQYDAKLLVRPNGRRRLANLRKLLQMANSTAVHGVADFIRRLREIEKISDREGDAPTEEEESDVVKLITIHKAKGLEFPIVFLADMGRGQYRPDDSVFVCDPRTAVVGCKLDDYRSAAHAAMGQTKRTIEDEESLRLLYVAVTRAIDHLYLCGSTPTRQREGTWADLVFPQCGVLAPPGYPEVRSFGEHDEIRISPFTV